MNEVLLSPSEKTKPRTLFEIFPRLFWLPLVFLTAFSFYLFTLCPSFFDDDSPETITAAWTLGLQHPPSYAFNSLFTHFAVWIPLGNPCFQVNFLSALLAAGAVTLLASLLFRLLSDFFPAPRRLKSQASREWPALACATTGSLFLAFSPTFWEKALGAKGGIYILETLLLFALWNCLIEHEKSLDPRKARAAQWKSRWFALSFFLLAVGFTHHWQTEATFIPALVVLFLGTGRGKPAWVFPTAKTGWTVASFFVLGLSTLLYLPLRAHLHPVLNLGAPDNFQRFLADLFRQYYAGRERGLFHVFFQALGGDASWRAFGEILKNTLDFQGRQISTHLAGEMKWPALLLAVWGASAWWRKGSRKLSLILFLPFGFLLLALYSIPPQTHFQWYLDNFLIPADGMTAFLAAVGLYDLFSSPRAEDMRLLFSTRPRWSGVVLSLGILALPFYAAFQNFPLLNQRNQVLRYDYGENLLKSLPADSIFFAEADEDYFPLYYFQNVAGQRPDLKMIPAFLLFEPWGVEQMEERYPGLGLTASQVAFSNPFDRIHFSTAQIVAENQSRSPLTTSYFNGAFHLYYLTKHPTLRFQTSGLALRLIPPGGKTQAALPAEALRFRHEWDCPSNGHESLEGIRQINRLAAEPAE